MSDRIINTRGAAIALRRVEQESLRSFSCIIGVAAQKLVDKKSGQIIHLTG
jgi:hypothetical protein